MINVTKTYLPPKNKYIKYIDGIYENGWVTNNGPLVQELERKLAQYLNIEDIILVSNGTVALELAYKALELHDCVITTPFSFVATTNSIISNNLTPIFADINSSTYNIDVSSFNEKLFKENNISAIVPVHVFGNGCEIEEISQLAKMFDIKIVYDAAHAFGVKYKGSSILQQGDISTISFHATKLFHTIEGGAIIANNKEIREKIRYMINFGIKSPEEILMNGTNAKMNEFQAAMGLCILDDIDNLIEKRKKICEEYEEKLGKRFTLQSQNKDCTRNYSYFPILLKNEESVKFTQKRLNANNIYPRRYFYPSLDTLPYISPARKKNMLISQDIAKRILCLPLYPDLENNIQELIIKIVKSSSEGE